MRGVCQAHYVNSLSWTVSRLYVCVSNFLVSLNLMSAVVDLLDRHQDICFPLAIRPCGHLRAVAWDDKRQNWSVLFLKLI